MLTQPASWTLQIAILSTGIYLFLRFLRTTRGGGLLRGLFVAFLFGVIGLWGLSKYLELEELNHIIEGFTPYVAVILTIIFQPELRRAMARLGQHNRLAQLLSSGHKETVTRVAGAAVAMAARRHGALIAFQQETSLDAWTANAAHIDAEVSATLLESIFHPGASLHDGGVVIDGDRVVAAACLFPLTENIQLSKSTGTRHRAALGLTEESDAVTLIVSEETGQISIARQGFMSRDIPAADLEQGLRDALGISQGEEHQAGRERFLPKLVAGLRKFFLLDLLRKGGALILASGMIYLAHQDIIVTSTQTMQVLEVAPGSQVRPSAGLLQIRLPEGSFHLVSPSARAKLQIKVSGTQAQIDRLPGILGGVLDVPLNAPEGATDIAIEDISWIRGSAGLDMNWDSQSPPRLEIERYMTYSVELLPEHVEVDLTNLDAHFVARVDAISFGQDTIEVEGPREVISALRQGAMPFALEPILVRSSDHEDRRESLRLSDSMRDNRISILGGERVLATLSIEPAEHPLLDLDRDITLVNLRPGVSGVDARDFVVGQTAQQARFKLTAAGIFDSDPGTDAFKQTAARVSEYARQHLKAYVDVSDMTEEGGVVPVHWDFPSNWREDLFPGRESEIAASARIEVLLVSDSTVLLTPK
ncbi:MAG: diadenylate cyclase [Candidatus Paceibacteria bacterium]